MKKGTKVLLESLITQIKVVYNKIMNIKGDVYMENKKYELTDITMEFKGIKLYRIKALKNFSNVKAGDLGGWVSSEYNLSQYGNCWIYDNAICMNNSKMYDNSKIYDDSKMYDNSKMYDDSMMFEDSEMYDDSVMRDDSVMYDNSKMYDNSRMYNNSVMYDDSVMYGSSEMRDHSVMYDNSTMHDSSKMYGSSMMFGNSEMHDNSVMYDNSEMWNDSKMYGNSEMLGYSEMYNDSILKGSESLSGKLVSKVDKFIEIINPLQGRIVTGVLKEDRVLFNVGCQDEITKEVFIDRIYNKDGGIEKNPHRKEYLKIIDMIELYLSK